MTINSFTQKFSSVNGLKLTYSEAGAMKHNTLVFIHGLGENRHTWAKNIEGLKDQFHCLSIDLPGHGESESGDYPYTPYFFAETISEFLQHQKINGVTLVGHSLGGQIAVLLGISKPTLVNKLVLISPAGFEQFSETDRRWLINHSRNYMNPMQGLDFRALMPGYKSNFPSNEVYGAAVRGMLDQPVFDHLKLITQPTLIIFGEEDPLIPNRFLHPLQTPKSVAEAGAEQISVSKLLMIKGAGHFVHLERIGEVDEAVRGFAR